ncbi:MAG TPA: sugar ABC transporter permease, partial [Acidimicrobiales bacterium]|nr:sugar ABC transporter permease [Acidimicrobiales bacterium]
PARGAVVTARWWKQVGWRHAVAWVAVAFALFPVVWVASASINPSGSLASQKLIPDEVTLDHYRLLFTDPSFPFLRWLLNTLLIGAVTAVGTVFLCALAAYAFSRLRFRGRRVGLLTLLLVQMFPQLLAMVAIYLLMLDIDDIFPSIGLGTRAGLILVYLGGALGVNTWLMKGFFDTIPIELDESAKVDGASHLQIFFRIVLPLVAPILAVVGLLSFILTINEFVLASVLLQDTKDFTLAVGLFRFVGDRYGSRWGPFTAGALMGGVPVIVVWLFLQRYVVTGLTRGAVKG